MIERYFRFSSLLGMRPQHGPQARATIRGLQCSRTKWRHRLKQWRWRIPAILLALPIMGWSVFAAAVVWWPYPSGFDRAPAAGTFIEDRRGVPLAALVAGDDQWHL